MSRKLNKSAYNSLGPSAVFQTLSNSLYNEGKKHCVEKYENKFSFITDSLLNNKSLTFQYIRITCIFDVLRKGELKLIISKCDVFHAFNKMQLRYRTHSLSFLCFFNHV